MYQVIPSFFIMMACIGLTVPRSINFDPEVLTTLLQQVASNEITVMKAIEEMRTTVYHDPSKVQNNTKQ